LVESKYVYNATNFTLEHYFQEPADYDEGTYSVQEKCLEGLSECRFSYSDGSTWKSDWDENLKDVPRMIRLVFKFKDEEKVRELVVNVPVSP
jgi:hypothetical protein